MSGNFLAVLAFAWAYILLACWLEMQQSDAAAYFVQQGRIFYLAAEANQMYERAEKSLDELYINIGNVDDNAACQQAAILALGKGWRAEITRNATVY